MSSCLRNLKFSAHQSYLSLKPSLFRAQSYPTIGFYSCANQSSVPNRSAFVPTHEKWQKRTEICGEVFSHNVGFNYEFNPSKLQEASKARSRNLEMKFALCLHKDPVDALLKEKSRVPQQDIMSSATCPLTLSVAEANLCNQLRKNNVTVFSGFLEASPYPVLSTGASTRHQRMVPVSDFQCGAMRFADLGKPPKTPVNSPGKPSAEQLHTVFTILSDSLPKFFTQPPNYTIYHENIVFENNIRGKSTRSLKAYMKQMALIRFLAHLRYAQVKLEVLKITQHPEDGTVRVRWRINGVSGMKIFAMFWRFRVWDWKKSMQKEAVWIDGFSIFHVGADGLVFKHVCDKMMPDDNRETVKARDGGMEVKLALMLGLMPELNMFGKLDGSRAMSLSQRCPSNLS